jgi:hypothetical protein
MNVDEVKQYKANLEKEIRASLDQFMLDTGTTVTFVNLMFLNGDTFDKTSKILASVDLEVQIV